MLNLPVPEAEYINEVLKPSEEQKEMVEAFSERAEQVRGGAVDPRVDNMLKITNDGRKLALDQRMLNDMLPDFEGSLKISNGKWIWWSRGIGGRSALDYLIKVKGYSFLEGKLLFYASNIFYISRKTPKMVQRIFARCLRDVNSSTINKTRWS